MQLVSGSGQSTGIEGALSATNPLAQSPLARDGVQVLSLVFQNEKSLCA
jgi:hypothetical protein